ncbi:MAG: hypothetical protein HY722_10830 [Planctomycetes bacterium]|nr:hypothetical protein [Planctomycetota bacterium]
MTVSATNRRVGHDFPTGPLDLIQSWLELEVRREGGEVVFRSGIPDERHYLPPGTFIFMAEGVDREGQLIDRHNLWEMVGARYRRALFPGYSDRAEYAVPVPREPAPGVLEVRARLQYRKFNQYVLDLFYPGTGLTSPITTVSEAEARVRVLPAE